MTELIFKVGRYQQKNIPYVWFHLIVESGLSVTKTSCSPQSRWLSLNLANVAHIAERSKAKTCSSLHCLAHTSFHWRYFLVVRVKCGAVAWISFMCKLPGRFLSVPLEWRPFPNVHSAMQVCGCRKRSVTDWLLAGLLAALKRLACARPYDRRCAPPLARARGWRPPVCFSLVSCSSFRNNSPSLFSVVSLALDPCPFAWSLAASRHIRRAAARSLIWMAKRCWPNRGLFRACALFLPLCGSHLCCPTVPYCFAVRKCWQQSPLTLPRCFAFWCWLWGDVRVLGMREGGVPFYSCAQLLFLIEASFRLRWDHVFSLRSVRDLLKCFCRFNAVEQGAALLANNTCLLYVVTCQRYAHFVLALYSLSRELSILCGCVEWFYFARLCCAVLSPQACMLWWALEETSFG